MNLEELKTLYWQQEKTTAIADYLNETGTRLHLRGLVGSSQAMIANAILHHSPGIHLFVLEDKEEAAYFLNDLENITD